MFTPIAEGSHSNGPFSADEGSAEASMAGVRAQQLPIEIIVEPERADPGDLRRRRRKELIERILDRTPWLPAGDRMLVEAVYRDERTVAELAPMLNTKPRTLRRRVQRLVRRMLSPEFMFVVGRFIEGAQRRRVASAQQLGSAGPRGRAWNRATNKVAEEVVLNGRSLRETAQTLHLSLHAVRRYRDGVRMLFEERDGGRSP